MRKALPLLLLAAPAHAAGGAMISWATLGYHALNLAALLLLIYFFARKPLAKHLKGQAASVSQEINEAHRLHEEAEAMLKRYEAKLAQLQAEGEAILAQQRAEAEVEKARLIKEGVADANRIRLEAKRLADNEIARAKARLEAQIVNQAIEAAEGALRAQMSDADHARLVDEYLTDLEALPQR
ncbi:ATP synthase F0 subunit B [Myxococcota bacterium]|nr:ATP synthase F0 subunit B [Myxococcota bacterium]